jgi:pimeloyl-ACP methyl ester carboxylesterase
VDLPLKVTELGTDRSDRNDGDTFLLLHGFAGSSFTWRGWAPDLALRGRVLLVDMKGFGEAPKPDDGRYSPIDFAELVARFMKERDLRRVTLVGHSLGGGVALLSALQEVGQDVRRIVRLVLVAAPGYRQRLPPFVALSHHPRLSTLLLRTLGPRRVIRGAIRSIVYDRAAVSNEQIDAYSRPLGTKDGVRALLDAGRQVVPEGIDELSQRFGEISVPVLLMWGRQDRVVPLSIGERLAHDLPHARLEILERCGHLPPEELPEQSWQLVASFLEGNPVL